jgi:hypothetical protein
MGSATVMRIGQVRQRAWSQMLGCKQSPLVLPDLAFHLRHRHFTQSVTATIMSAAGALFPRFRAIAAKAAFFAGEWDWAAKPTQEKFCG